MDQITKNLCKADIVFGLKPALEKFGFPQKEDLFISFKYEDQEYTTGAMPFFISDRSTNLNTESIETATIDWLNKAEMQFPFNEAVGEKLGIKPEGEFATQIKFFTASNEFTLTGKFYWPCSPGAGFCCYR